MKRRMTDVCNECHHIPSGRFCDSDPEVNVYCIDCYCKCHDVADTAPLMLKVLKETELVLKVASIQDTSYRSLLEDVQNAIEIAEGRAK